MAERFAGQDSRLALVNSTTQDPILPNIHVVSMKVKIERELVKRDFLGETGPDYREFEDGISFDADIEFNNAAETVLFLNARQAKGKGLSNDQFSVSTKYRSPDGGTFRIVIPDIRWEGDPLDLGGRKELLKGTVSGKAKTWKAQLVS